MFNFKTKSNEQTNDFQPFIKVLSHLKDIIQEDVMISITDEKSFLAYYPGDKMKIDLEVGRSIPEGDPLLQTIANNEIISSVVPEEVYGMPFKAVTYPIRNSLNKCIGAIGFGKNLEKEFSISESLNDVLEIINGSNSNMDSITSNLNSISMKTEDNSSAIQQSLASIQEITSDTQFMSEELKETEALTNEVKAIAEEGTYEIENIVNSVNTISESTKNVVALINELNNSAQKIGDIVNLINGISDQTNLLALNAAIEAARAGDQGRGFAVVADEVRRLAEQSKNATVEISDLVTSIQNETHNVIAAVKDSESKVSQGVESSQITSENIKLISESITLVHDKINKVSSKANMQVERASQVTQGIEVIAHSANEASASTQSIYSSAEAQRNDLKTLESSLTDIIEKLGN